jgi:hypothetical protein
VGKIEQKIDIIPGLSAVVEKQKLLATKGACEVMIGAFMLTLNSEFGFGTERLNRVMAGVKNQVECLDAQTLTLEDMLEWLEEHGVDMLWVG